MACTFSTSELPKVVRRWCVLYILTWKCASPHKGVHFLNIWTSKRGPRHFDLETCFGPQRRALFQHRNFQKWSENGAFCTFWLGNVLRATTVSTFQTSELPKVVRDTLTWKCASGHNSVHFLDIGTSKSGPTLVRLVHFDLEMCFAPQPCPLFKHLNFQKWSETFWLGNVLRVTTARTFSTSELPQVVRRQKWSENGVLCTCWLGNALRATAACTFSTSQLQKVLRTWGGFAPQRRATVPISSGQMAPHPPALASLLFDPPNRQIIGQTQWVATFLPFRAPDLLTSFLLLSDSSHLCFSNCPYCRKFHF